MPLVRFMSADGSAIDDEGDVGQSVMELAKRGGIAGIIAECGGSCACATCHVIVAEDWQPRLEAPSPDEIGMLEFVSGRRPASRLACQIRLRVDLDGLVVAVPNRKDR
jgi:2Fe-2S ferredoxin